MVSNNLFLLIKHFFFISKRHITTDYALSGKRTCVVREIAI